MTVNLESSLRLRLEQLAARTGRPLSDASGALATSSNGSSADQATSASTVPSPRKPASAEPAAIDLLEVAGASLAKRAAPVALLALVLWWLVRRR